MSTEIAPMEGSTLKGGIDNAPALKKQRDDFGGMPQSVEEGEAILLRELAQPPRYRNICSTCGNVHPVDGEPICRCVKCEHMCRIVWCGQCVCCAYARFSERFGEGVAQRLYPKYADYLQKQREEQVKANKLPWE